MHPPFSKEDTMNWEHSFRKKIQQYKEWREDVPKDVTYEDFKEDLKSRAKVNPGTVLAYIAICAIEGLFKPAKKNEDEDT